MLVTVKSRWSGSKLIIGTVSVVSLSDTKSILLISDKYRLPIPSGRLSAFLSELYFGACQTASNKTHFITVTCSVFFLAAPTQVHKLLGPAQRATLFENGAKGKNKIFNLWFCAVGDFKKYTLFVFMFSLFLHKVFFFFSLFVEFSSNYIPFLI